MRSRTAARSVVAGLAILTCAACSAQSGPEAVSDGSYAFLNSSQATDAAAGGQEKVASLTIAGKALTLTQVTGSSDATIGDPAADAVLCPPKGKGEPLKIDGALAVGRLTLTAPAIFGPCPDVNPKRVTIVDLDSFTSDQVPFGYTRWVALCDTKDPDC